MRFISDCFYGVGVGYRGNMNVTQSGRKCQSWKSQCPHRHWRIPKDVADSKNDFNMCDPNVRWEYCNVSRCPSRGKFSHKENLRESRRARGK